MENRKGRNVVKSVVGVKCTSMFKCILRDFMGESALAVLERQLSKKLAEADPFEHLLTDPKRFYDALASILGPNVASTLLKLLFKRVANKRRLTWLNVDDLITAIITGEKSIKEEISKLLQEACGAENT